MTEPKKPATPKTPVKAGERVIEVKHKVSGRLFTVNKSYFEANVDKLEAV